MNASKEQSASSKLLENQCVNVLWHLMKYPAFDDPRGSLCVNAKEVPEEEVESPLNGVSRLSTYKFP